MTKNANTYCTLAVIRYLNGDFEEFERLKNMAIKHYENEAMAFKVVDFVPAATIEKIKMMIG